MSRDEALKYSVKLLRKLGEEETSYLASLLCAEAEKDYNTMIKYLDQLINHVTTLKGILKDGDKFL